MGLLDKIKENVKQKTGKLIDTTRRKFARDKSREQVSAVETRLNGRVSDSDSDSDDALADELVKRRQSYEAGSSGRMYDQHSSHGLLQSTAQLKECEVSTEPDELSPQHYKPKRVTAATTRITQSTTICTDHDEEDAPVRSRQLSIGKEDDSVMDLELARAAEMIRAIDLKRGKPVSVIGLESENWSVDSMQTTLAQPNVYDLNDEEMESLNAVTKPSRTEMVEMGDLPGVRFDGGSNSDFLDSLDEPQRAGFLSRCWSAATGCCRPAGGFQRV